MSTDQGLVVPVLRDADAMGLAEIEKRIGDLGKRARDGKLAMEELTGGTFSITNGGIFGSLMSTPILNPPQVGILGMHEIQERRDGHGRRPDRGPADDVPGALLRPPHHRRPRGGELPGPASRSASRRRSGCCWTLDASLPSGALRVYAGMSQSEYAS